MDLGRYRPDLNKEKFAPESVLVLTSLGASKSSESRSRAGERRQMEFGHVRRIAI